MGLIESKRAQRLYDTVVASRKNCRFEDIERLLLALGFECRQPKRGGSHYTFRLRLPDGRMLRITVPRHRPVNEVYVDAVLEMIASV